MTFDQVFAHGYEKDFYIKFIVETYGEGYRHGNMQDTKMVKTHAKTIEALHGIDHRDVMKEVADHSRSIDMK